MTARRFPLSLFLLLALAGCGVKGSLVQKGEPLPAAPANVEVRQLGADLLLSWSAPTLNQDGSALNNLQRFIIARLPYRVGDYCAECRDTGADQIQVYVDRLEPAFQIDGRFYLRDSDLPLNVGYRYRIIPVNSRNEAGADALTHRDLLLPPEPPTALRSTAFDRSLRLNWENSFQQRDKAELLGVNIYRTAGDAPFSPVPINSQPITGEQHDDFNLENGQLYRYGLRSLIKVDNRVIESAFSEIISATPRPEF